MRIILGILTNMHRKNLAKRGAFSSRWDQKDGHESKNIIPHKQRAEKCPEMRFSASTVHDCTFLCRGAFLRLLIDGPRTLGCCPKIRFDMSSQDRNGLGSSVVFSQLSLERHNWRKTCCVFLCDFGKDESSVMSRSDGYNRSSEMLRVKNLMARFY
jgi:hypothetical protein